MEVMEYSSNSTQSGSILSFHFLFQFFSLFCLFVLTSLAADEFICPNMEVVAEVLRLSDSVAGVTVLALGNGAPDLFTAFAGAELDHPEILFAGLTGSATFTVTIVAGTVLLCRPFVVETWGLLRNIFFFCISYTIFFMGFFQRNYSLYHIIGMMITYFVYLLLTLFSGLVNYRWDKYKGKSVPVSIAPEDTPLTMRSSFKSIAIAKRMERKRICRIQGIGRPTSASVNVQRDSRERSGKFFRVSKASVMEFMLIMKPYERSEWMASNCLDRLFIIFKAPIMVIMRLLVPVVNKDEPEYGWSKVVIMINMFIYPSLVMFAMQMIEEDIYGVPVWIITVVIGSISSIIIFFTTRVGVKPKGHSVFSFFGFVGAVMLIRILSSEVVIHLQTIGARFTLSSTILAITVLAWGNCLGDLVSDVGLAKQGLQNMGMAACYGGPMFNCSVGVALVTLFLELKGKPIEGFYGDISPVGCLFLYIALFSSFIFIPLLDFQGRKFYGIYLILLYVTFFILGCLMEKEIHTYGTMHYRKTPTED